MCGAVHRRDPQCLLLAESANSHLAPHGEAPKPAYVICAEGTADTRAGLELHSPCGPPHRGERHINNLVDLRDDLLDRLRILIH